MKRKTWKNWTIATVWGVLALGVVALIALPLIAVQDAHGDARPTLYEIVSGQADDELTTATTKVVIEVEIPGKPLRTYNISVDNINQQIAHIDNQIAGYEATITYLELQKTAWEDCRTTVAAQVTP